MLTKGVDVITIVARFFPNLLCLISEELVFTKLIFRLNFRENCNKVNLNWTQRATY